MTSHRSSRAAGNPAPQNGRSWPGWRVAVILFGLVGFGLSSYLGWHQLVGGGVLGCGDGSPCDQVLNSRWSSIAGVVPVSGLAAGAYLALLVAGFNLGPATEMQVRSLAWRALLLLVGAIAGSAVWFVIVQRWMIGAFCPYCLVAHANGLLLAGLVLWRVPRRLEAATAVGRGFLRVPVLGSVTIGVALAGLMAVGQSLIVPPSGYQAGQARTELPKVPVRGGPMIGSPEAAYVVTVLFDYQCPHCQVLHFMLAEVVRRYQGKLAFALCPTPLNSQCNPYVARDRDEFAGSCELAQVALAVWLANREVFPDFELWMFSMESGDRWQGRSLAAARSKAIELVGPSKFDAALADPWVEQYLQEAVRVYGQTVQDGRGGIPKLVLGGNWVIPQPNDVDDLIRILQESLAVPPP